MKTRTILALAVAAGAFAPAVCLATQQGTQTMGVWKGTDRCAAAAQRQFPDYTAVSNAKRDAALKACLAGSLLPPREAVSPPAPAAAK